MNLHGRCTKFPHIARMADAVGPSLKAVRERTVPRLSIRQVADRLGIPPSSYAFYENPNQYKRASLPLDFARKVAAIFMQNGIDPADVLRLAGLTGDEAEPEGVIIEAQRPAVFHVSLPVALPNEAVLTDMFRAILAIVPDGASRDETAQILARRLPTGFAAIGPFLPAQGAPDMIGGEASAPSPSIDHLVDGQRSRT